MFGRKDYIQDMEVNDGKAPVVKVAVYGFAGILATAVAVTKLWDDGDKDVFLSTMKPNEMFCLNPQFDLSFRGDPYDALRSYSKKPDHDMFWNVLSGHKILSIPLDYNEVSLEKRKEFLREMLKDVIDKPEVTFIIAGHATYDLDEKYPFLNVHTPKGFDQEHEWHMRNNFSIAAKRIESTREILKSIGIDESRIVKEINHGVRYDKRAVDLEICMPQAAQP